MTEATEYVLSRKSKDQILGYRHEAASKGKSISVSSTKACQDYLNSWKNADTDLSILQSARAEYAKLSSQEARTSRSAMPASRRRSEATRASAFPVAGHAKAAPVRGQS